MDAVTNRTSGSFFVPVYVFSHDPASYHRTRIQKPFEPMMKRTDTPQPNRIAEAVTAYHAELYRFAALRTGSRSDAEDIVQEAFLKLLTASGEITHPRAYLYRCVANACCDLKRRRSFHEPLRPDQPQESPDPALREEAERLAAQLDRIPPEQAEAIRLHTFAALRFTEIAEILDIPVTTVKSRFQYGIEKLRNLL